MIDVVSEGTRLTGRDEMKVRIRAVRVSESRAERTTEKGVNDRLLINSQTAAAQINRRK